MQLLAGQLGGKHFLVLEVTVIGTVPQQAVLVEEAHIACSLLHQCARYLLLGESGQVVGDDPCLLFRPFLRRHYLIGSQVKRTSVRSGQYHVATCGGTGRQHHVGNPGLPVAHHHHFFGGAVRHAFQFLCYPVVSFRVPFCRQVFPARRGNLRTVGECFGIGYLHHIGIFVRHPQQGFILLPFVITQIEFFQKRIPGFRRREVASVYRHSSGTENIH